jgi:hypothetical protein
MKYSFIIVATGFIILMGAITPGLAQSDTAASQIDAIIDSNEIVIADQSYKIASNAEFYASDERSEISFSRFEEGDWVEFSLNENGEIDEMWMSSE